MSGSQNQEEDKLLYFKYLFVLSINIAYENVPKKKLIDIFNYFAGYYRKNKSLKFYEYKTLTRHYNKFIIEDKSQKLNYNTSQFYESFLEVSSFASIRRKYQSEIKDYDRIIEKLKNLNSIEKSDNDIPNKYHYFKIMFSKFHSIHLIILLISLIILILILNLQFLKNRIDANIINNFNASNQYFYKMDEDGQYFIKDHRQDINEKPLTPEVFDTYFVQQGYDTKRNDIKIIKANYFNNNKRIIDNEVSNLKTKIPISTIKNNINIGKETNKNDFLFEVKSVTPIEEKLLTVFSEVFDSINFISNSKTNLTQKCKINTSVNYQKSKLIENGSICILDLYYKMYNSKNNQIYSQKNIQIKATGFNEQESLNNALIKFKSQLP